VLLHGFGSTGRIFDPIVELLADRYEVHAPDLPGHGSAAAALATEPTEPAFDEVVSWLLARLPDRFTLAGYSLGGRVALHLALAAPNRLERLFLISTTAGIDDPKERAARRSADLAWARSLETEPYERFIERWRNQPLFAGETAAAAERSRGAQLENDPLALAAVMRRLGSGVMEPLWDRLADLYCPAVVVAGTKDRRYQAIGKRLAQTLPKGAFVLLPGGHNLVAEAPQRLAELILDPPA
jgi:2-succinyl-6-hydroxy-2,4-cyclohexadiene-1-carboxylate synthase